MSHAEPDTISGGAGGDKIFTRFNTYANLISGGDGDDIIEADDGYQEGQEARDTISCGDGKDQVDADKRDLVAPDCEEVERF